MGLAIDRRDCLIFHSKKSLYKNSHHRQRSIVLNPHRFAMHSLAILVLSA